MNQIDDSNLAQCCACGFVDYWDEIPKGRCVFSEDYLTECPECGDVDGCDCGYGDHRIDHDGQQDSHDVIGLHPQSEEWKYNPKVRM